MSRELYYSYGDNLEDNEVDWIHIFSGKPVPPTFDGSYNHLIWELVQRHSSHHFLIAKYYPESYELAKKGGIKAVYIDYTPKLRLRDRLKPIFSDEPITYDREFVEKASRIISKINCSRILLWGAIHQLAYYRWNFPSKTIAYAHRWNEQPELGWARQYSYCDYLLTLTPGAARRAFEQVYNLNPIVVIIPNGVNLNTYHPISSDEKQQLRMSLEIPKNKKIAIFPSMLRPQKGISYLLHWIKYCRQHLPEVFFLVLGGFPTSPHVGNILELKNILETSDNVRWLRGLPYYEMPRYYQVADFCLAPSVCPEGMSMAVLEALASALPVVYTECGSFFNYIWHGYNGLLCKSEDILVEGIRAIEALVKCPDLLTTLSTQARFYAEKRLPRKRCLDNFTAFFEGRLLDIDNDLTP